MKKRILLVEDKEDWIKLVSLELEMESEPEPELELELELEPKAKPESEAELALALESEPEPEPPAEGKTPQLPPVEPALEAAMVEPETPDSEIPDMTGDAIELAELEPKPPDLQRAAAPAAQEGE